MRTQELARQLADKKHSPHSARELLVGSLGSDPYETLQELNEVGKELAKLEGIVFNLQQSLKPKLAVIASELAVLHRKENLSESKLDRLAKADKRYQDHIVLTAEAISTKETARNRFWHLRSLLDWDRASISHLNAVSKLEE
tara:strand:- start:973 stop:1398 length:426 start_codon:yes stop_codon:yes gene_type:complete